MREEQDSKFREIQLRDVIKVYLKVEPMTYQARHILTEVVPEVLAHFVARNAEYGEGSHVLGLKGQYADINRKTIKLKRYVWDGVPVPDGAESIEIIATELIGHLLLLIEQLRFDEDRRLAAEDSGLDEEDGDDDDAA